VHGPSRADGPFELAPATTDLAAVLGPPKLDLDLAAEKRQLHRANLMMIRGRAMSFR
jgi:hypothetical protein